MWQFEVWYGAASWRSPPKEDNVSQLRAVLVRKQFLIWLACCSVLATPQLLQAQAVYATIRGLVADSSGKAVAGALITAVSLEKGTSDKATSNKEGLFTIDHLLPDTYDVGLQASGYKLVLVPAVTVYADDPQTVDFHLTPGNQNQTVMGEESALKTDRADVASTLSSKEI